MPEQELQLVLLLREEPLLLAELELPQEDLTHSLPWEEAWAAWEEIHSEVWVEWEEIHTEAWAA